jgi:hypothetical protein
MYWDKPIHKQFDGIEFNLGQEAFEKIHVSIDGKLRRSLFRKDMVQLNIKLGDRDIPDLQKHHNILPLKANGAVATSLPETNEFHLFFKGKNTMEQYVDRIQDYYWINIAYRYYDEDKLELESETIGALYIDKDFDKILITLFKQASPTGGSWNGGDGKVISSETTIEDTKKLLQDIWHRNK